MDEFIRHFKFMVELVEMYYSELEESIGETYEVQMDLYRAESFIEGIGRMEEYRSYCIEKDKNYGEPIVVHKH